MTNEEIEIVIGADGKITGEVFEGPGGEGCFALLDELLAAMGENKEKKVRRRKEPARRTTKTTTKVGR